jgi:hypothetical protein
MFYKNHHRSTSMLRHRNNWMLLHRNRSKQVAHRSSMPLHRTSSINASWPHFRYSCRSTALARSVSTAPRQSSSTATGRGLFMAGRRSFATEDRGGVAAGYRPRFRTAYGRRFRKAYRRSCARILAGSRGDGCLRLCCVEVRCAVMDGLGMLVCDDCAFDPAIGRLR